MTDLSALFQHLSLIERSARNAREMVAQAEVLRAVAERPSVATIQNGQVKYDRAKAEAQFGQLTGMAHAELGNLLNQAHALQVLVSAPATVEGGG